MEKSYIKEYEEIYKHHWVFRAREHSILHIVQDLYKNNPLKILDIGCGPGLLIPKLKKYGTVEGIEAPDSQFKYKEDIGSMVHRTSFPSGTGNFPPGKYDLILLLDVLEHIEDDMSAILELRRLLKKNGFAIVTVPAFMSLWGNHDIVNHHFRRYTFPELAHLTSGAGFDLSWSSYFLGWCFLPTFIIRRIRRFTEKNNPRHDFQMPPDWLNNLFTKISDLEFHVSRACKVPFGVSLIMVIQNKKD
jgi:SAM-dependent methyltransferase